MPRHVSVLILRQLTAKKKQANSTTLREVQLLPYHDGGSVKHRALGQQPPQYTVAVAPNPEAEAIFRSYGLPVHTLGQS